MLPIPCFRKFLEMEAQAKPQEKLLQVSMEALQDRAVVPIKAWVVMKTGDWREGKKVGKAKVQARPDAAACCKFIAIHHTRNWV